MSYDNDKANAPDPGTVGEERDDSRDGLCEDCQEDEATREYDQGMDFHFWTGRPRMLSLCAGCWMKRENAEPQPLTFDEAIAAKFGDAERLELARKLK